MQATSTLEGEHKFLWRVVIISLTISSCLCLEAAIGLQKHNSPDAHTQTQAHTLNSFLQSGNLGKWCMPFVRL